MTSTDALPTVDTPWPVALLSAKIKGWIDRLGPVWVEGQIAQLSRRQGMNTVFMTLRDTVADISVTVTCSRQVFDSLNPPVVEGATFVDLTDLYSERLRSIARDVDPALAEWAEPIELARAREYRRLAADQLINNAAKLRFMTAGRTTAPITVWEPGRTISFTNPSVIPCIFARGLVSRPSTITSPPTTPSRPPPTSSPGSIPSPASPSIAARWKRSCPTFSCAADRMAPGRSNSTAKPCQRSWSTASTTPPSPSRPPATAPPISTSGTILDAALCWC